jgi:hypothetical protein
LRSLDRSKPKVSPQLQDAWVICARDLAKRGANVLGIVVEVIEFRVVEDVERINAEFERDSFAIEWSRLCQ